MEETLDAAGLSDKLAAPFNGIVCRHRASLMPMLGGSETAARDALSDDEAVRKLAVFCYPLLPGIVRLAIKEHTFVGFVMNNRDKLLVRLTGNTVQAAAA